MRQHALAVIVVFAIVVSATAQQAQKPEPAAPPQTSTIRTDRSASRAAGHLEVQRGKKSHEPPVHHLYRRGPEFPLAHRR